MDRDNYFAEKREHFLEARDNSYTNYLIFYSPNYFHLIIKREASASLFEQIYINFNKAKQVSNYCLNLSIDLILIGYAYLFPMHKSYMEQ